MSRRVGAGPAGTACARAPIARINKVANRVISHSNLAADLIEPWSANWTSEHLDYHRNGMISNARPKGHWLTIMRGSGRILVGILIACLAIGIGRSQTPGTLQSILKPVRRLLRWHQAEGGPSSQDARSCLARRQVRSGARARKCGEHEHCEVPRSPE